MVYVAAKKGKGDIFRYRGDGKSKHACDESIVDNELETQHGGYRSLKGKYFNVVGYVDL